MTETEKSEIRRKYSAGCTMGELQRSYNISYYKLSKFLNEEFEVTRGPKPHSVELQNAIIREYGNGAKSVNELAEKFGLSRSYIYMVLNRAGVKFEGTKFSGKYTSLEIYKYIQENPEKTQSEIARELGVTRQRINGVIKNFKVKNGNN